MLKLKGLIKTNKNILRKQVERMFKRHVPTREEIVNEDSHNPARGFFAIFGVIMILGPIVLSIMTRF